MDRIILHSDCNNFFASVESVARPEYKNVPLAVSGDRESRHGIILAKNEIAKSYGVKTAEPIWQAKQKCPNLVTVPPHHELYEEYSEKINKIYFDYTDQVERFSVDESWLDVTGSTKLFGDGKTIADTIRERVKNELGFLFPMEFRLTKFLQNWEAITKSLMPQQSYPVKILKKYFIPCLLII